MTPEVLGTWLMRAAGFAGLTLFGTFFVISFSVPQWVERIGASFIAGEIIVEVDGAIDAVRPPTGESVLARAAADLYAQNGQQIEQLKATVKLRAREALAAALAQVRDPKCECRRALAQKFDLLRIQRLIRDNERLADLLHGTYMKVKTDLTRELRIFTATNAACFLLLLIVSYAKPGAARHLLFPGVLLACATVFCAWIYVFSQNWLLTIIHGSYVGVAYAAYLGIAFLFLCDIALNRGRVATRVINGVCGSVGSVFAVSPC